MAILGIDEVGRGPLAGPLVVGAVIIADATAAWCAELTDSKKLSAKRRQVLYQKILQNAPATALGWVSSRELDQRGMAQSLRLATRRAVNQIIAQKVPFEQIIIDGTVNFLDDTALRDRSSALKKADLLVKAVSAASIIAKLARDQYMVELASQYPDYAFDKHVGYCTALHRQAIARHGLCPEHRQTFRPCHTQISQAAKQNTQNSSQVGQKAETIVANWLLQHGHSILQRNHKTKFYEIDLISLKDQKLYFTEVKYRKTITHGTPLDFITQVKLKQMQFAAQAFLRYQPYLQSLEPQLAVAAVSGADFHFDNWFALDTV